MMMTARTTTSASRRPSPLGVRGGLRFRKRRSAPTKLGSSLRTWHDCPDPTGVASSWGQITLADPVTRGDAEPDKHT